MPPGCKRFAAEPRDNSKQQAAQPREPDRRQSNSGVSCFVCPRPLAQFEDSQRESSAARDSSAGSGFPLSVSVAGAAREETNHVRPVLHENQLPSGPAVGRGLHELCGRRADGLAAGSRDVYWTLRRVKRATGPCPRIGAGPCRPATTRHTSSMAEPPRSLMPGEVCSTLSLGGSAGSGTVQMTGGGL